MKLILDTTWFGEKKWNKKETVTSHLPWRIIIKFSWNLLNFPEAIGRMKGASCLVIHQNFYRHFSCQFICLAVLRWQWLKIALVWVNSLRFNWNLQSNLKPFTKRIAANKGIWLSRLWAVEYIPRLRHTTAKNIFFTVAKMINSLPKKLIFDVMLWTWFWQDTLAFRMPFSPTTFRFHLHYENHCERNLKCFQPFHLP